MSPWFRSAVTAQAPPGHRPPPPQHRLPPRRPSDSKSRSGTPSLFGLGILLWITVRFAGTISWISVLSAKPTKLVPQARNVPSLGGFATMHSTSTASAVGSRHVKCVHWITVSGSFRSMATRCFVQVNSWSSRFLLVSLCANFDPGNPL